MLSSQTLFLPQSAWHIFMWQISSAMSGLGKHLSCPPSAWVHCIWQISVGQKTYWEALKLNSLGRPPLLP